MLTIFIKNYEWYNMYLLLDINGLHSFKKSYQESLLNVESLVNEFYISISLNSVSFIFSFITILLTIIAVLSDHNHENESTGLYNILCFSTTCLIICSVSHDLF